jgi:hypothetical protein
MHKSLHILHKVVSTTPKGWLASRGCGLFTTNQRIPEGCSTRTRSKGEYCSERWMYFTVKESQFVQYILYSFSGFISSP